MQNPLLKPILRLTPYDAIRGHELTESIFVAGAPGSGKTTCLDHLLKAIIETGWPVMIHIIKPDEADRVISLIKKSGHLSRLRVIGDGSSETFDAAYWEYSSTGKDQEAFIDFNNAMLNVNKPTSGVSGEARFFDLAAESLIRAIVTLQRIAGEKPSLSSMADLIRCLPTSPQDMQSDTWRQNNLAHMVKKIEAIYPELSKADQSDLDAASGLLLVDWPNRPTETTGSVCMTALGVLDKFCYHPLKGIFSSGESSLTPQGLIDNNEIHIINFPITKHGIDTAKLSHLAYKIPFVRHILRRVVKPETFPTVSWTDEFGNIIAPSSGTTSRESEALAIGRSARLCHVSITQGLNSIAEAHGENTIGAKTRALISNYGTRIWFRVGDYETATFAADGIGRTWQDKEGESAGLGDMSMSVSSHKQLAHIIEPTELMNLQKPDSDNPVAHAIVHWSRPFKSTGCSFSLVKFTR